MAITFPTNTKTVIDGIRTAIGRLLEFQIEHKTACSTCTINPITDESTDPYCPECSGIGYLITYTGVYISGHVTQNPTEVLGWATGGQYIEGDCRVQIEYTDENLSTLDSTKYIIVDGQRMRESKRILRGVPNINRIIIDLKLEE